jgi:hypothetical protein
MLPDGEASFLCDSALSFFYFGIVKFLDPAALHAYQMIMMRAFIQFEHGFAGFEVVSGKDSSMFKLSQDPVNRGQPYVNAVRHQDAIYILGREVADLRLFEQFQNTKPRARNLEADGL